MRLFISQMRFLLHSKHHHPNPAEIVFVWMFLQQFLQVLHQLLLLYLLHCRCHQLLHQNLHEISNLKKMLDYENIQELRSATENAALSAVVDGRWGMSTCVASRRSKKLLTQTAICPPSMRARNDFWKSSHSATHKTGLWPYPLPWHWRLSPVRRTYRLHHPGWIVLKWNEGTRLRNEME